MMDAEAKAAANRALAEALGWTDIRSEREWVDERNALGAFIGRKPVTAWWGVPPGERLTQRIPDFYGSVDATLAVMPTDTIIVFQPDPVTGKGTVALSGNPWNGFEEYRGEGDTRAEALASACAALVAAGGGR